MGVELGAGFGEFEGVGDCDFEGAGGTACEDGAEGGGLEAEAVSEE